MFDLKTLFEKTERRLLPMSRSTASTRQQRLMLVALSLLLATLGLVLYRDRDFWFPDALEATNQPLQSAPSSADSYASEPLRERPSPKKAQTRKTFTRVVVPVKDATLTPTTITRTVLPPLEVEVVAGRSHSTLRPGVSSVQVEVQAGPDSTAGPPVSTSENDTAAAVTTSAADRGPLVADSTIVSESVQPSYPMLARQMKVQGAVILQALVGRDGQIQDLRVISGPPILATAAREAVKQWHFKPHYEGAQAVETQAKITVNFTISTN